MNAYLLITIINIIILAVITLLIFKLKKTNKEKNIGGLLISSGIGFIASSFPSFLEKVFSFIIEMFKSQLSEFNNVNYISLLCGIFMVIIGIYYELNIRDRFFILNILSKDKRLINDKQVISDLGLSDFKLREYQIDVVRIFNNADSINSKVSSFITEEIEEKTKQFINQSNDFKRAFTGMFSIPFTILSGTYLSATEINDYFEYNSSTHKFYKLKPLSRFIKKNKYQKIKVDNVKDDNTSQELVVAISITRKVNSSDLLQFNNMKVINIEIPDKRDNVIQYREQLNSYSDFIIDTIENLKCKYSKLNIIHLLGAIPSCLSIELGRRISLRQNRLPKIISYHYKNTSNPKYCFGIIITEHEKGKYIKP